MFAREWRGWGRILGRGSSCSPPPPPPASARPQRTSSPRPLYRRDPQGRPPPPTSLFSQFPLLVLAGMLTRGQEGMLESWRAKWQCLGLPVRWQCPWGPESWPGSLIERGRGSARGRILAAKSNDISFDGGQSWWEPEGGRMSSKIGAGAEGEAGRGSSSNQAYGGDTIFQSF